MKVLDVRPAGRDAGVYLQCLSCWRRWRERMGVRECRCPDCERTGDLLALVEAWAWDPEKEAVS